jgi:uncharacterized protein YigE (DUF2233 family)
MTKNMKWGLGLLHVLIVAAGIYGTPEQLPPLRMEISNVSTENTASAPAFISHTVEAYEQQHLAMYWKNDSGTPYGTIAQLQHALAAQNQGLKFAVNGGMFDPQFAPQGLFIDQGVLLKPLDTHIGDGNFYIQPNGVFLLNSNGDANIVKTADFVHTSQIRFATQSGPMLVVNGQINPAFQKGSTNLNIRNAVGLCARGALLFVQSKIPVNFYDLAAYYQQRQCTQALYLDGFVSQTYLPEQNQTALGQGGGQFGVMIGQTQSIPAD